MDKFGLTENTLLEVTTDNETNKENDQSESDKGITIPVKFNKQIKNLTREEATVLAQKGLKFDSIAEDYASLKELASQSGKSVPEFLQHLKQEKAEDRKKELTEQCGGNEEMAAYVLALENQSDDQLGFAELQKEFPVFKKMEEVPQEVMENAKLKGRLLLDEYLRYRYANQKAAQNAASEQNRAGNISIGSLKTHAGSIDPAAEQFIKGILK